MPIKIEPDAKERKSVEEALDRLRSNQPKVPVLRERSRRGSLQSNLNTLSQESGVKRHRIEKLYPDLAAAANSDRGDRGESVPLRKQLDGARRAKELAERRLEQSQAYSFRLMEVISKLRGEVQMLKDQVTELEEGLAGKQADEFFIGTDDVIGIPPMPAKKKPRRGAIRARG